MMKSYEWMREYDPAPAKTKTTGLAATTSAAHYGFTLLTENARGRTHPGILLLVYCLRNKRDSTLDTVNRKIQRRF